MRKIALRAFLAVFAISLAAETMLRIRAPQQVLFYRADKQAHCPDASGFMMYCPNVRVQFNGDHFQFHLTTDERGERITSGREAAHAPEAAGPEIWMLGDSIVSGYGIDDEASAPYLIAQGARVRVRNLAVDGLGIQGTIHRFKERLSENRPVRAYYLFDYSEFADEARESRVTSSALRRFFMHVDTLASRLSMVYCALRAQRPGAAPAASESNLASVSRDHPAFGSFQRLAALARSEGVELVVIVYPGGGLDGRPGTEQTYQDLVAAVALLEKTDVLDLRSEFLARSMQETLYIPGDGHPGEAGARLIAEAVLKDIRVRPPAKRGNLWK